jgi:hypothetical protein
MPGKKWFYSIAALCCLSLLLGAASADARPPAPGELRFALTPVYQFDSNLDSGGDAGFGGFLLNLSRDWSISEQSRSTFGVSLDYSYQDWRFNTPGGFDAVAPWGQLNVLNLSLPFTYATDNDWYLGVSPSIGYSGETGANFSDSLQYGGYVTAVKLVNNKLLLGFGIAVYEQIEKTNVFPIIFVDWQISDHWRLSNPAFVSPSGPAGMEISYDFGNSWDIGLATAYRSTRFRLDSGGAFSDGVGEHRYYPVLARIGYQVSEKIDCDLYMGATVGSELRVEDANGKLLFSEDSDPAAVLGFSLVAHF